MASLRRLLNYMKNMTGRTASLSWRWGRWVGLCFVAIFMSLWIACVWIDRWLAGPDGVAFVVNSLRDVTGADVQLASIKANLPHRLKLQGLALRMPKGKGTYEKTPSITVQNLEYHIAFSKLLYGTFELSTLLVDGLEISGERRDGRLWIAGMLEYIEAKKANQPPPPPEPKPEDEEPLTLSRIRGMFAKIIVPVRVVVGEVGIKNLTIDFRDFQKNTMVTHLHLGPMHAFVSAKAWMATSTLSVDIGGDQPENNLDFRLDQFKQPSLIKKIQAQIRLNVQDLKKLDFSTTIKGTPVPLETKIGLLLSDNLEQIDIQALDVTAGKILTQHGQGTIRILDDSLRRFLISFSDEFLLNLSKMSDVLPESLAMKLAGEVHLKKLAVSGELDLDSLKQLSQAKIPNVELDVDIDNVSARTKMATVSGFLGKINVHTTTSAQGGVDVAGGVDLKVASVMAAAPSAAGTTKASITNFSFHTAADLSRVTSDQEMAIDKMNVSIVAEKIAVTPPGKPTVRVPLKINVDIDSKIAAQSGQMQLTAELGPLLKTVVHARCGVRCEHFSSHLKLSIIKIEDIYELVRPLLPQTAPLPELKKGRLEVALQADVIIPANHTDLATRLKAARPKVNSKISLSQLGVEMPAQKLKVAGIDVSIATKGDLNTHKLSTDIEIESIEAAKLPEPLYKTKFELLVKAQKDGVIAIEKLLLAIPGVGSTLAVNAKTELDAEKMPQNLHLEMNLEVDPKNVKVVPKFLKLTGRSLVELQMDAPDLSQVQLKGDLGFEDFGLELKEASEGGEEKKMVVVENLRGHLPFQQSLNVKEMMAAKKPEPDLLQKVAIKKTFDQQLDQYLEKFTSPISTSGSRMTTEYYGEMRPLYKGRTPITIDRIQLRDLKFEQIEIDAELKQNQFSLNQLVIGLLGGKVQGGMQASFDTRLREVRFAGQWTRLDTRKLAENFPKLQEKMQGFSLLASSPYIDGTLRLKYDAVSGDIAGGMEITSIGKEQLKMIFMYIDPDDKNPTIVSIRKALNIGEVRQVSVPIRNGQIGVDVDVRVFSAPIPTPKLQRFPLAQLVRNFTAGTAVDKAKEEEKKRQ